VLDDRTCAARAAQAAAQIHDENGAANAAEVIEQVLQRRR
jgi:hypothetical protein